jgi:cytochrome b561
VFNWFAIPSPLPPTRSYGELIQHAHSLAAYAIIPLVGLHILGALKHALIDRDGVLRRMLVPRQA